MIEADARTIPWLWRGCSHVYDMDAPYPRRCMACRAIDHGRGPAPRSLDRNHGYILGTYPYPLTAEDQPRINVRICGKGHEMVRTLFVRDGRSVTRNTCKVCRDEARAARLMEPCNAGHVGERFYSGGKRAALCRVCEAERKRIARAASITRSRVEASQHA